jgi:hypothetical protein
VIAETALRRDQAFWTHTYSATAIGRSTINRS